MICENSKSPLDIFDGGNWSQGKECLNVRGEGLVEGEASKPHDGALGVANIEQIWLVRQLQHIVYHGRKISLSMLIKPACFNRCARS